jgi:glycosyltransferase involved in cell wall biosynthesis
MAESYDNTQPLTMPEQHVACRVWRSVTNRSTTRQLWIVPDLEGPTTGGTLYNLRLIAALRAHGVHCEVRTLEEFLGSSEAPLTTAGAAWLDSLYLADAVRVRAALASNVSLGIMLHYLPWLLAHDQRARARLERSERAALACADFCVTTSATALAMLQRLGRALNCGCVEPGVSPVPSIAPAAGTRPAAFMIANLTANKGVLPFLQALAQRARDEDCFTLAIVGSHELEPEYAAQCACVIASAPSLRERVRLLGARKHEDTLTLLAETSLLVSASYTESYGMALAEARAAGVPIVARAGGHIAAHVSAGSGGELVIDDAELADAFLRLVRDPALLTARREQAAIALQARSWNDAARDFLALAQR